MQVGQNQGRNLGSGNTQVADLANGEDRTHPSGRQESSKLTVSHYLAMVYGNSPPYLRIVHQWTIVYASGNTGV